MKSLKHGTFDTVTNQEPLLANESETHPTPIDSLAECLLTVARIHNQEISRASLTSGLPLVDGKLTPSLIPRAAKRLQMSSQLQRRKLSQINFNLLPAILLLNESESLPEKACVLQSIDHEQQIAHVAYPDLPDSFVEISLKQLESHYQGTVIYIRPEFKFDNRANQVNKNSLHWFWGVIRENRHLYRDILIASIFINLFAIAMPLFVMNVYDRVVPNHATETLWILAAGILIILIAELGMKLLRSWFIDLGANRADVKLSSAIMEKVLGMKMADRPSSSGSFVSNIQSFESIRSFIGSLTVVALVDLPFVLLFTTIVALIAPIMAIPIIVGAFLILSYAFFAQNKMHELSLDAMQAGSMRNATLYEGVSNLETLKSFNVENKTQADWEKSTIFLTRNAAKMRLTSASISQGAQWVQHAVGISVIILGVYSIIEGNISQGALIAAYMLSSRAMGPIGQTAGLLSQYHYAATAYESLEEIMNKDSERPVDKTWISPPIIRGEIEFQNVNFKYPNDDRLALKNVSFKIKPGEHIAILGRNGSGKTTLEKLILGLYQPESGHILIDGVDLRHFDPALLRRNLGYMPQDISLFYGSLKDNITIAAPSSSDEEILKATHLSGLDDFIRSHPAGFDMPVGERGQLLSGGQKQSVALARAIINDPPVLIFDEPTGSLDFSSESQFINQMAQATQGKTLITITHRTPLLKLVSRIIVMDNGKVVADGPKESVLEALKKGRVGSVNQ